MELLAQELFITAVVAVFFSFVIAKLVSVAMSGSGSVDGKVEGRGDPSVEEVRFGEERLRSLSVGSERRVVEEELRTVDLFGDEQVGVEKEVVEPYVGGGLGSGEAADEPLEITELPEELSKKEDEESLREASQLCDVEVRFPIVDAGESSIEIVEEGGKEEEEEEIVDEDDWEGIERSELEKDFAAAARFVDDRKDRLEAAMGDEAQMQLYGLHKVATEGPCRDSPPMDVKVTARANWYHCFSWHCAILLIKMWMTASLRVPSRSRFRLDCQCIIII